MAAGARPVSMGWRRWGIAGWLPGGASALALVALYALAVAGLLGVAGGPGGFDPFDPYVLSILRFSLIQAGLSTLLSLALGAPLALALARRQFPGRDGLIKAMAIGFVTPVIVAVLGIVAVHGRAGWLNQGLGLIGLDGGTYLYGLPGILIAHVFFNAPLAARIFLQALQAQPAAHWRLAAGLGMPPGAIFRLIDWPVLRREAPGIAALIFLLCFTSFATVLTLGGGPAAQTLEVAIYQALAFELDFQRALALSAVQIALCLLLTLGLSAFGTRPAEIDAPIAEIARPDRAAPATRLLDGVVLLIAAVILLPPALAILLRGLSLQGFSILADPNLLRATLGSLQVAIPAGLIALLIGFGLAWTARHARLSGHPHLARLPALIASIALVAPPFVLAAGLFAALVGKANPLALGPVLVPLVNGIMAAPFVFRLVGPALDRAGERHDRLCRSLGIRGLARLIWIDWPAIRRAVGMGLAIATAFSLGDFGVIALFGGQDFTTLPHLVYRLMGSYRLAEAGSTALVLLLLIGLLFWLLETLIAGRRHA